MTGKKHGHSIEWRGPEFLFKPKTLLWYTHVLIFFFLVISLLIFIGNWPGAGVITLLFIVFILKSNDRPRTVTYSVNDAGITIGETKIAYSEIHSFSLDEDHTHPVFVLDLNYYFALPVTLVAKKENVEEIKGQLLQMLPRQKKVSFLRWLTHLLHY